MELVSDQRRTRKLLRWCIGVALVVGCVLLFRNEILRGLGHWLIRADKECHADALYVLGGATFDRGTFAAGLLKNGCVPVAYCTGSNIPQSYKAEGRRMTEALLTRAAMLNAGASPAQALPFPYGTSTFEEAEAVLHHARQQHFKTITVLTTDFHTRRVKRVFAQRFAGVGIRVLVNAAPSSEYEPERWWASEQGLLMVNNEYVKTLYYWLKH
ncbi:MAG: YdcF family protein [Flavobacteriales bacterium]|nr:YdcF family protein [Flavobacteriales bacterium]